MISLDDIRSLATLARLKLTGAEEESLQKDMTNILDYVGQVSAVSVDVTTAKAAVRNVMREDKPAMVLGKREALLAAFPKREGDFDVVRKIIDRGE
jgi:aspartyl/glutamyl-tRNA(Asn/Gln) amidotransferase C subunit